MRSISILLLVFIAATYTGAQPKKTGLTWPELTTETKPFTRWWWFGSAVDKTGITYTLEELSKAGLGGVEITPIYGVKGMDNKNVAYLSPEWMNMLSHSVAEAKRLGLHIEMATGTGWPFGGPLVTTENAASKLIIQTLTTTEGQYVSEKIKPTEKNQENVAKLQIIMAFSDKGEKKNLTTMVKPDGTLNWMPGPGNWKIIVLFNGKTQQKVKRPAPGGEGLVIDHFSPTAFDAYANRFNTAFTQSKCPAPAVFFNDSYEVYNADWSPEFLQEFKNRRGYSLEEHLDLFAGMGDPTGVARVKSDYRETMAELLHENFTQKWTNWAHSIGAKTRNQAHGSPGNLLDLYATVDIPECESFGTTAYDIPGLRRDTGYIRPGDADPLMLKFASSGAHIAGKKLVSSETFTWLGEHFRVSLSQCKPQLDDIFASGINHVFFHGTPYSPKDAAWPGWEFYASVNFSPNNRFWRDIPAMTSYIARCQSFLQMGQPDNDFLVYFPIHDLWNNSDGTDMPFTIHGIEKWLHHTAFYNTSKTLTDLGYGIDYISDKYITQAKNSNNQIETGGNKYKALIVPYCRFMPVETLKAILALAKNGGNVIFVELPSEVPGLGNLDARYNQMQEIIQGLSEVPFQSKDKMIVYGTGKLAIGSAIEKSVHFLNIPTEGILEHHVKFIRRKNTDGYHYFFANLQSKPLDSWVTLAVNAKSAALFNPLNGKTGVAKVRTQDGITQVRMQLNPGESMILKTFDTQSITANAWAYTENKGNPIDLAGPWKLSFTEGTPTPVAKEYTLDKPQSWTELPDSNLLVYSGTGKYSIAFSLPPVKANDWLLTLGEVRESARVIVNGTLAGTLWSVPFTLNIGQYLKPGKNTLDIEVTNLDANRISGFDRNKIPWKIFNDINVVNVNYKPFDASTWLPMPSGLLGPVTLTPINLNNK